MVTIEAYTPLKGYVYNDFGKPVGGLLVRLYSRRTGLQQIYGKTVTNRKGMWEFTPDMLAKQRGGAGLFVPRADMEIEISKPRRADFLLRWLKGWRR